jgi:hypothetical protein
MIGRIAIRTLVAIVISCVCLEGVGSAQSFPSAANLSVIVSADIQTEGPALIYRYSLTNERSSLQDVAQFAILSAGVQGIEITSTPTDWLSNNSIGGHELTGWTPLGRALVKPGQTVSGFSLRAESLPGIVEAVVVGFIPFEKLPEFPDGRAPDSVPESSVLENSVRIRVLGPVAVPAQFDAIAFLDDIVRLKDEAAALGWIDRSGIEVSLAAKLNAALESLKRQQTGTARNQLQSCLSELDAQSGKHLAKDAVALLSANISYLLSRL